LEEGKSEEHLWIAVSAFARAPGFPRHTLYSIHSSSTGLGFPFI
jgi:hypothetical protein